MVRRGWLYGILLVVSSVVAPQGRADEPQLNNQYPIRSGEVLSPPIVGQVGECAPAVHVTGFIAHATVRLYVNGSLVTTKNPRYAEVDIQVPTPLHKGDRVTATQEVNGFTSDPSRDPMVVSAYPPLNTPVVDQPLYECGQIVPADNLNPGTIVDVFRNGGTTSIGQADVTQTWTPVVTASLKQTDQVTAVQTACPTGPGLKRVSQSSKPPTPVNAAPNPQPSPIVEKYPLHAEVVVVDGLYVGANVQVTDNGAPAGGGLANANRDKAPVQPATTASSHIQARQTLCNQSKFSTPLGPSDNLDAVAIVPPVCEGQPYVTVANSYPNSILMLYRNGAIAGMAGGDLGDVKMSLGSGNFALGDTVWVVQYVGSVVSPQSNTVIADCSGGGNVITQHNNNYRSGTNLNETVLTPAAVLARGMQVRFDHPVDEAILAQPLYVRRSLAKGRVNGLFVATMNNSVYALDADSSGTGVEEWHINLKDSDPAAHRTMARGISSTPVIDVASHRMYVLFSTKNQSQATADCADHKHPTPGCVTYEDQLANLDVAFWLVALDYRDGTELKRVQVSASLTGTDGTKVNFQAKNQNNHVALLLDHGSLYIAFGMRFREEIIEYHGWVMRYRASDLTQQGVFCSSASKDATTPLPFTSHEAQGAGIWGGGAGLSAAPDGTVYFLTGNGKSDVPNGMFGDAFIRLTASGTTLVSATYTPPDAKILEENDVDLGAGGTMTIPGTNLVIGGGKTGYMYLLKRDSMDLLQQLTASTNQYSTPSRDQTYSVGPHLHGSPNYWRGPDPTYGYLYVWGEKDVLRQYRFNTTTNAIDPTPVNKTTTVKALNHIMPGGMISISAFGNASGTGIVWATLPAAQTYVPGTAPSDPSAYPGRLYAFDAENLQYLWDTGFCSLGHWLEPTIADGKVFVGTGGGNCNKTASPGDLIAYELGPAGGKHRALRPFQPNPSSGMDPYMHYQDAESMRFLPQIVLRQLAPGAGAVVSLALRGEGEIIYESVRDPQNAAGVVWEPKGSAASLWRFDPDRPLDRGPILVRLVSETTWTASDGGKITVEAKKTFPSPDPTACQWVLFEVSHNDGKGLLSGVKYVQRVFTEDGAPPKEPPTGLGLVRHVPYKANYVFYGVP